jgi:hypothetical protein
MPFVILPIYVDAPAIIRPASHVVTSTGRTGTKPPPIGPRPAGTGQSPDIVSPPAIPAPTPSSPPTPGTNSTRTNTHRSGAGYGGHE